MDEQFIHVLDAVGSVDGRYRLRHTQELAPYFSERALIGYRIEVEGEYLIALSHLGIGNLRPLGPDEEVFLRSLAKPNLIEAGIVKDIETKGWSPFKKTNHDVKAVEFYMRHRLTESSLRDVIEWIHFGLTSEDVNNIAYALMLGEAMEFVFKPVFTKLGATLERFVTAYAGLPMLARTHGQPAVGTTLGKEYLVFRERFMRQVGQLSKMAISVKFNGAVGNHNALAAAFPAIDWLDFSDQFVESFNGYRWLRLANNKYTTQIEPHDNYAELFAIFSRLNNVLIKVCRDTWQYISDEWIVQTPVEGEVGSSAMPQKVNPIDLESAEGNLLLANAMLEFFCRELPQSRLQRHLSDSTIIRNFGYAFGLCLIGYKNILAGFGKYSANPPALIQALESHPEVIAEAYQTVLRREGVELPYNRLKELTRGKKVSLADLHRFVDTLGVSAKVKAELLAVTPLNYLGLAERLVQGQEE